MIPIFLLLILSFIIGIFAGIITGLLPGIHINLVAAFLLGISPFLLSFLPVSALAVFIVSMTITHTFLDFIPSIFLGAPDDDSVLAVLPGHELLLKGRGHEALVLTLYGAIIGLVIALILTPLFILAFPPIYSYLKLVMFFLLIAANAYLIFKDKNSRLLALIVFLLSGFLGIASMNLPLEQSLLPLLTGLFGSSSLITSIIKKEKLPKQKIYSIKRIKVTKSQIAKTSLASILAAPLCAFLPALGTGQAAIIGSDIISDVSRKEFLVLLGTINAIITVLSFVTVYAISKARTGTAVAIQKILPSFTPSYLLIILGAILASGILSFFIAISISKFFAKNISKFNYRKISVYILIFISIIVLIFSGWLGFLIFITATAIGLFAILSGARRTNLMGSLMLPAIVYYLPF